MAAAREPELARFYARARPSARLPADLEVRLRTSSPRPRAPGPSWPSMGCGWSRRSHGRSATTSRRSGRSLRRGSRARAGLRRRGAEGTGRVRSALRRRHRRRRGAGRPQPRPARRSPSDPLAADLRGDRGAGAAHSVLRRTGTACRLGGGGGPAGGARSPALRGAGRAAIRWSTSSCPSTSTPRSTICGPATRPNSRPRCGRPWPACPIAIACCSS